MFQRRFPCPAPGNLSNPGTEPVSQSPASAGGFFAISATWEAQLTAKKWLNAYAIIRKQLSFGEKKIVHSLRPGIYKHS